MWRHNYVIGRNEYVIFTLSESINPLVYSLQFLFKSTNNPWRYEGKCEWVFFFWTQCIFVLYSPVMVGHILLICASSSISFNRVYSRLNSDIEMNGLLFSLGERLTIIGSNLDVVQRPQMNTSVIFSRNGNVTNHQYNITVRRRTIYYTMKLVLSSLHSIASSLYCNITIVVRKFNF